MLRSMTAYSRVKKNFDDMDVLVEIQSINRKYLDIQLKLPPEFLSFDPSIRKLISHLITRGGLTVSLHTSFLKTYPVAFSLNMPLVKKMKESLVGLAHELGCNEMPATELFLSILREKGVLQVAAGLENEQQYKNDIEQAVTEAVWQLIEMKEKEGAALVEEFAMRLNHLLVIIAEIERKSADAVAKYREKLLDHLKQLFTLSADDSERVLKEVAILAEKIDISEEIVRFRFHVKSFIEILVKKEFVQGTLFTFILQEMQREMNTIGSKSQDAHITSLVIQAKSEIEKIREQVQNVE